MKMKKNYIPLKGKEQKEEIKESKNHNNPFFSSNVLMQNYEGTPLNPMSVSMYCYSYRNRKQIIYIYIIYTNIHRRCLIK